MDTFEQLCVQLYDTPDGDTVKVSTMNGWSEYTKSAAHLVYCCGTHDQLGSEHVYRIFDAAVRMDVLTHE